MSIYNLSVVLGEINDESNLRKKVLTKDFLLEHYDVTSLIRNIYDYFVERLKEIKDSNITYTTLGGNFKLERLKEDVYIPFYYDFDYVNRIIEYEFNLLGMGDIRIKTTGEHLKIQLVTQEKTNIAIKNCKDSYIVNEMRYYNSREDKE